MSGYSIADPNVLPAPGALFDVNLIQYLGVACGPLNPVDTDPVDRAARLLGIIYGNLGQIIQVVTGDAIATGNALSVAGFNFVYNGVTWDMVREGNVAGSLLVDPTDRAARLLGIAYGEAAQLQQSAPADAHANPADALEVGSFPHVWDPVGVNWNRWREGAAIGQALTDPADRWGRQLGLVDISRVLGAALTNANPVIAGIFDAAGNRQPTGDAPARQIYVEDSGLNTNIRRYEKDNGFYSEVVARAGGVATALWTIATTPARTAGLVTTIYTLEIENSTGGPVMAWLEIGGVTITVPFHIVDNDSITIEYVAGFNTGNADVDCNASVNDVVFSIKGTEA